MAQTKSKRSINDLRPARPLDGMTPRGKNNVPARPPLSAPPPFDASASQPFDSAADKPVAPLPGPADPAVILPPTPKAAPVALPPVSPKPHAAKAGQPPRRSRRRLAKFLKVLVVVLILAAALFGIALIYLSDFR
ncbi:MAG TPA: hypothetical protein VK963_03025 [Candidatus Saccharimonadales bacterium]|nr:hypothetical protein [Candidatus Saccharimonadales bacterium]